MPKWLDSDVQGTYSSAVWHSKLPVVAAGQASPPLVHICSATAESLTSIALPIPPTTPPLWHHSKLLFVIGLESGEICSSIDSKPISIFPEFHTASIVALEWISFPSSSSKESKIASSDQDNVVVVWKLELSSVKATILCNFRLPLTVPIISMLTLASRSTDNFLAVTSNNLILLSDRKGFVLDASSPPFFSTSTISRVVRYPHQSARNDCIAQEDLLKANTVQVFVLSENGQLTLLTIADGDKIISKPHVKIGVGAGLVTTNAMSGSGSLKSSSIPWSTAWISRGIIAVCNGGGIVRVVDFDGEEGVSLEVEGDQDAHINSIAYDSSRCRLVAATDLGYLNIWESIPIPNLDDPGRVIRRWRALPKTPLSPSLNSLSFHPVHSMLLAISRDKLKILSEHKMVMGVGPNDMVIQTAMHAVSVVQLETPDNPKSDCSIPINCTSTLTVPSELKISGMTASNHHVVIWSTTRASVIHLKDKATIAEFSHASESMFLTSNVNPSERIAVGPLVQVSSSHILIGNLTGKISLSIPVTLTNAEFNDDKVTASCATGDFVATLSKSGRLSVIKASDGQNTVTMRNLTPLVEAALQRLGIGRKDEIGDWEGPISVNADGSYVALKCTVGKVSMLAVYGHKYDSISVDPVQPFLLQFDILDPRYLAVETLSESSVLKNDPAAIKLHKEETRFIHTLLIDGQEVFSSSKQIVAGHIAAVRLPYIFTIPTSEPSKSCIEDTLPNATTLVERHLFFDFAELISSPQMPALQLHYAHNHMKRSTEALNQKGSILATPAHTIQLNRRFVTSMIDFRISLARGDVDQAFKLMPLKSSKFMWLALAKMCLKARQLSGVVQCLAHAGEAGSVRLVRKAQNLGGDIEALGLCAELFSQHQEVHDIYAKSGRWDLATRSFIHARNDAFAALKLATTHDSIEIPRAHFECASAYIRQDPEGKIEEILSHLEKSTAKDNAGPRFLLNAFPPNQVVDYLNRKGAPIAHIRWHAKWFEAQGDLVKSLSLYEQAKDVLSIVRVQCELGNISIARDVAERHAVESPAAAYHLAQYYETQGKVKEAVGWYAKARCVVHATQLAKDNMLYDDVMSLAMRLENSGEMVLDAAQFFERQAEIGLNNENQSVSPRSGKLKPTKIQSSASHLERAIRLYKKAGVYTKALELALDNQQFDLLLEIVNFVITNPTDDLPNSKINQNPILDQHTLSKIADILLRHQQFQKAIELLILAGETERALDMCVVNRIELTEHWVDRVFAAASNTTWVQVANACMQMGNFQLASKKYASAGDKVNAVKALIKLGDMDQVIYFTTVSGPTNKDIYVLAANFLQATRDWRTNPSLIKHIVLFYTKAKAFDHLASFFEACAVIEIDEYSRYDKALSAFKEANKCMLKSSSPSKDSRISDLSRKVDLVMKFITAQHAAKAGVEETLQICAALLNEHGVDIAVRAGDIYALLVETYLAYDLAPQARDIYARMLDNVPIRLIPNYLDAQALSELDPTFDTRLNLHSENISETSPTLDSSAIHPDIDEEA